MKERAHMDDSLYSPKEMFGELSLDYNNEENNVKLPTAAEDLEAYSSLDANESVRIRILRDWNWVRAVYTATMLEYKEVLHEWNKGTGGGSGLLDKFESWGNDKCNKYDIDPIVYDHTDVSNRPTILMDGYATRKPYLTCIFIWDEKKNFILSSKYQPLEIGSGETGFTSPLTDEISFANTNATASSRVNHKSNYVSKRTSPVKNAVMPLDNLAVMVSSVIGTVMKTDHNKMLKDNVITKKKGKKRKKAIKPTSINEESLPVLMALVEKHQNYMKFLKDCGMLTQERTTTIVAEIDRVFDIIRSREKGEMEIDVDGKKGVNDSESDIEGNNSSSSSSVS